MQPIRFAASKWRRGGWFLAALCGWVAPPVFGAAFSELVGVTAPSRLACELAGFKFEICPEFKSFPSELRRYDLPTAQILRLPEIVPFHRRVAQSLPKAQWLQMPAGQGQGKFLSTNTGNYLTAFLCKPSACAKRQYLFAMEAAYRKKWAVFVRYDVKTGREEYSWYGDPDNETKAAMLAARALHRGETPAYIR